METPLLKIEELKAYFYTDLGVVRALDGVSLEIRRGQILGLVGESGCGKSVTARAILNLIPPPGKIVDGRILFHKDSAAPVDLAKLPPKGKKIRQIRGKDIAMIFQEPMVSLSPVHTIGNQIIEAILLHESGMSKKHARDRAIELLRRVRMPRPEKQIDAYSFELSGGMSQRATIAMAISTNPTLLIADEPTTALDVTIQARILNLLRELQEESGMSILFITHDLGVIAELASEVAVMYLGRIVEKATVGEIYDHPKHPYTRALLRSIPNLDIAPKEPLTAIEGSVPDPLLQPPGCAFSNRCPEFIKGTCDKSVPDLFEVGSEHLVRCFLFRKEEG